MGLFDEEEYADNHEPQRGRERDRGRSVQRDVFHQEFGFGSWSARQVGVVAVLLLIALGAFFMNFGTDPATISDRVKSRLGMTPDPLPGKVLAAHSVDNIVIRYTEHGETKQGRFALIGLTVPRSCSASSAFTVRRSLPRGARVTVQFDAKLGRDTKDGRLAAYVDYKARSVNRALLEQGAAKLDTRGASQATFADDLRKAQVVARQRRAGVWLAC